MQHADNLFVFLLKDLVREIIQFYKMKIEMQCTCQYSNKTNVPPLEHCLIYDSNLNIDFSWLKIQQVN